MTARRAGAGGYAIARARPEHVAALPAIERAAGRVFPPEDVPAAVAEEATPRAELAAAQAAGRLWVVLAPDGAPVGWALLGRVDGAAHLLEMDVHPDHARRGLGRRLLAAVQDALRADGERALTLTTFRHLRWNAPFYASCGFRVLAPGEPTPGLAAILADEARRGLDPAKRCAMRCELAP